MAGDHNMPNRIRGIASVAGRVTLFIVIFTVIQRASSCVRVKRCKNGFDEEKREGPKNHY